MKTTKVALYCRVSTSGQMTENQVRELRRFAERRDDWEIAAVYEDTASGAKDDRPALGEMLADARRGRFDLVAVWKLDRLGRSVPHLLQVLEELRSSGVAFTSVTESIDTGTAHGRMVMTFLAAVAEFERELIRERIKAGIERARESGTRLGRPRVGLDIGKALELHEAGLGVRRIAKRLGVSYGTVYRSLKAVTETSTAKEPVGVT